MAVTGGWRAVSSLWEAKTEAEFDKVVAYNMALLVPLARANLDGTLLRYALHAAWPSLMVALRPHFAESARVSDHATAVGCRHVVALEWMFPGGAGLDNAHAALALREAVSKEVVSWLLDVRRVPPQCAVGWREGPKRKDASLCGSHVLRWMLQLHPEHRQVVTAERLMFGTLSKTARRLDYVALMRV